MEEPSDLERRLRAAADAGEWLDWSEAPDQNVPAELLYTVLVEDAPSARLRAVKVRGACVVGHLDLEAATLRRPLHLAECEVGGGITLSEAIAPAIRLRDCSLNWLVADQLETRGDLDLTASSMTGEVRLVGAHIGGELGFSGAQLTNEDGPALRADRLRVDGNMFCRVAGGHRFTATGEVRLIGAHIGGQLGFSGAQLTNEDGPALSGDGLRVDGGMFCRVEAGRPFTAIGEVRMIGAHIGGQLGCSGAQLTNEDGPALNADGLRVDGGMLCQVAAGQPFTATGEVRLLGAHIGGQLHFGGAQLTNEDGPALSGDGLWVDGDMFCRVEGGQPFTAIGEVRLLGAHIGGQLAFNGALLKSCPTAINLNEAEVTSLWLRFEERPDGVVNLRRVQASVIYDRAYGESGSWPKTRLEGCRYESLVASPPVDVETRMRWVRDDPGGYLPQPYEQLRDVLRRAGHEEDAKRVAIAKQRRRRKALPPPARAWSYILDAAVGYGYRTWRVLAALLAIIGIGWLVFAWASWDHLTAIKAQRPQFEPWLYSIDAVLPVINLGHESAWAPTGLFFEIWYVFSVVAGWLLGLGLIAALTAALFRE